MTDFNLSLWGAGAAVILSVIIYNFWQEYKAKKNVERAFGQHQDDVLMQPEQNSMTADANNVTANVAETIQHAMQRQEPSLHDQVDHALDNDHTNHAHLTESSYTEAGISAMILPDKEPLPIDEFIDCVIPLEFETLTRGEKIISEIQSFRRVGNKPVHFIGTNAEGKRELVTHAASYNHLLAGVQLVTRSGPLNELEYSELITKLRQIADNLNAYPDIPDMKHVMDAGRDLHLFVAEHDAQLSVNVKAKGAPWGMSTLVAALEKHGFDARPDGRLVMSDGDGGVLFTLSTNGTASHHTSDQTTDYLTLLLDMPCVAPSRGGFKAMVSCAKLLALRLGGSLVDDDNNVLDDTALEQIQEQVELFYSAMHAAEIPAGSTRAVRIFN